MPWQTLRILRVGQQLPAMSPEAPDQKMSESRSPHRVSQVFPLFPNLGSELRENRKERRHGARGHGLFHWLDDKPKRPGLGD